MNRKTRQKIARDTEEQLKFLAITSDAKYKHLHDALHDSKKKTQTYKLGDVKVIAADGRCYKETSMSWTRESTLECARRLIVKEGLNPLVLNFASGYHPSGAQAQEESICRVSALPMCLETQLEEFYLPNRKGDEFFSHAAIYSPGVVVLKDDEGEAQSPPFLCSFVSAPAPHRIKLMNKGNLEDLGLKLRSCLTERVGLICRIALLHQHTTLVLGAWGCGVYGNSPQDVAGAFATVLKSKEFHNKFQHVIFPLHKDYENLMTQMRSPFSS